MSYGKEIDAQLSVFGVFQVLSRLGFNVPHYDTLMMTVTHSWINHYRALALTNRTVGLISSDTRHSSDIVERLK